MRVAGLEIELGALHLAVAGGGIALGLAAAIWALAEHRAARAARRGVKNVTAWARAAVSMRDALLAETRESLLVWDGAGRKTLCHGDADVRLRDCLDGPDASQLLAAIDALHGRGEGFELAARDPDGRKCRVRGRAIGGSAAVWLEREDESALHGAELTAALDALPMPIWLRDPDMSLRWANRAFLTAVAANDIGSARDQQAGFDKAERSLAKAAASEGRARETERYVLVDGIWRNFALTHIPLEGGAVAAAAIDGSRAAEAEVQLKRHLQNQSHLLDKLPSAIAVFGPDRRLEFHNTAFASQWGLGEEWLQSRPTNDDLLDRLREMRRLPERRDYQAWKRQHLALYAEPDGEIEETWPLADGTTLRVGACRNPLGGVTVLYEDVSEKFALESSLKTLVAAQSATLDVLGEAVAAFGPDGRLTLHNAAFADIWQLDRTMLAGAPHIRAVAQSCLEKFGDEAMWERLVTTATSSPAQRRKWRNIHRTDGSVLSLSTVPLPDHATLMTFADVTDSSGIETALRERNEALEMVDRMRAGYIKHLSHELRTPLNTVLGFAEHLAASTRATLPDNLRDPLEAIVTGSYVLKKVIDDMLAGLLDADALARQTAKDAADGGVTGDAEPEADVPDGQQPQEASARG